MTKADRRRLPLLLFLFLTSVPFARAQLAPVIRPRGVVDAFTQEPSPSSVAPGGLVWINGLNFGALAETQVLVNGKSAHVASANANRIVAQIPADTVAGLVEVVVQRGDVRSRPALVLVVAAAPSVRSADDSGYGEAFTTVSTEGATLTASGFGQDAALGPVVLHVGGMPATAEVKARDDRPGEYDVKLGLPTVWQPGDVISLRAGARTANRTTIGKATRPETSFLRLPSGVTELRSLAGSDLRGNYLIGSAARDAQGCVPSYLFDFTKSSAARIDTCLVSGNQGLGQGAGAGPGGAGTGAQIEVSPVTAESEGSGLAALIGPAEGQAPAGISSKVLVFHPERAEPMTVKLPAAASSLTSFGSDGITAVLAGESPKRVTIDTRTGEVREETFGNAVLPGAGLFGVTLDLGDGLNQALSTPAAALDGSVGVVVGDSAERPTRMRFAIIRPRGEVTSLPFPENWLAVIGPVAAAPGGNLPGGGTGPGPGATRASALYQPLSHEFYVLASDTANANHGFAAFPDSGGNSRIVRFPSGWFAAACTTRVPLYSFQLSSSVAAPVSPTLETEPKSTCLARGLAVAEAGTDQASVISFPAQAPLNLSGATSSMNDFVFGGNAASPDTMVVFDGAIGAVSQLSVPAGISSYSGLTLVSSMNAAVAIGTRQTSGDAGFVFFDLERGETRNLGLPDRFSSASILGVFPVTRKLVATGTRSDSTGSQFIVYDLISGDSTVIPNPEGVAWVGSLPQQQPVGFPGGGFPGIPGLPGGLPGIVTAGSGLQQANTKANTVSAICFGADRNQVGVIGVRIP